MYWKTTHGTSRRASMLSLIPLHRAQARQRKVRAVIPLHKAQARRQRKVWAALLRPKPKARYASRKKRYARRKMRRLSHQTRPRM